MSTTTPPQTTPQSEQPFSVLTVLVGGMIAISFSAIFVRVAQDAGVPSLLIACARLVIAAALLTPFVLRGHTAEIRGIGQTEWALLVVSGVVLALHFITWVSSLEYTTVLISVTLVTTTPIWTALLEAFVLRVHLHQMLIVGLVIAFLGGLLIGIPGEGSVDHAHGNLPLGATLAIIGAITVSIYFIIGRRVRTRLSLLSYIWIVYGVAGLVLMVAVIVQRVPLLGYSWAGYAGVLASAIVPQLIGHTALNYAVKYTSATYVSVATKLEPIGSAVWAFLFFAEVPTQWQIIGSVVVTIGVAIATIERPAKSPKIHSSQGTH